MRVIDSKAENGRLSLTRSSPIWPRTAIMVDSPEDDRHDFMEFFSPPRVSIPLIQRGFRARYGFDILTGYDFLTFEDRARALRLFETHRPIFTMLSPPCTMYSPLQNANLGKMSEEVKKRRFSEADCLLNFSMHIAEQQTACARLFCFEHPQKASSWKRESVMKAAGLPNVQKISFDQCRVGLTTPVSGKPLRKRTTLLTNSAAIVRNFSPLQCTCQVEHAVIEGSEGGISLSKHCQIYTPMFVDLLQRSVREEVAQFQPAMST